MRINDDFFNTSGPNSEVRIDGKLLIEQPADFDPTWWLLRMVSVLVEAKRRGIPLKAGTVPNYYGFSAGKFHERINELSEMGFDRPGKAGDTGLPFAGEDCRGIIMTLSDTVMLMASFPAHSDNAIFGLFVSDPDTVRRVTR